MSKAAINFEYEWMPDGSLRLRFLSEADAILGQQIVARDALPAFQIMVGLAFANYLNLEPQVILSLLQNAGIDTDLATAEFLKEAVRIRTGTTPVGDLGISVPDEE